MSYYHWCSARLRFSKANSILMTFFCRRTRIMYILMIPGPSKWRIIFSQTKFFHSNKVSLLFPFRSRISSSLRQRPSSASPSIASRSRMPFPMRRRRRCVHSTGYSLLVIFATAFQQMSRVALPGTFPSSFSSVIFSSRQYYDSLCLFPNNFLLLSKNSPHVTNISTLLR